MLEPVCPISDATFLQRWMIYLFAWVIIFLARCSGENLVSFQNKKLSSTYAGGRYFGIIHKLPLPLMLQKMMLPSVIQHATLLHIRVVVERYSHELIYLFQECRTVHYLFAVLSNVDIIKRIFQSSKLVSGLVINICTNFALLQWKNPKNSMKGLISNSSLVNTKSYEMKKCIFMRKIICKKLHKILLCRNQS